MPNDGDWNALVALLPPDQGEGAISILREMELLPGDKVERTKRLEVDYRGLQKFTVIT